ncbi:MAG: AAA family ATPase [Candidatus Pacebacteria bacterium]|nr:AAA family ATPase [Candidatus Paceibacterota bacterium]
MQKKEIITLMGAPGAGKSSTSDRVAQKLGFQRFSSGDFMRKIALARGISLNELSLQAELDTSIDASIDDEVKKAGDMNKVVIDSRLAFHWIPNSFKVYLDLPAEIAKERILSNLKVNKLRQESENASNVDEVYKQITERLESEKKRYWELYKVDHTNKSNFDLVVDTNKNNLDEVVDVIVAEYKKWIEN